MTSLAIALPLLRARAAGQPRHAVELSIVCMSDKKTQPVRGMLTLPRGGVAGDCRVLVFAEGAAADEARRAGADWVLGREGVADVAAGRYAGAARCLAHPDLIKDVARAARFLGPRNLMPSAKKGTVTTDLANAVRAVRDRIEFKGDKRNVVRMAVARVGWSDAEVAGNIAAAIQGLRDTHAAAAAAGAKGGRKGMDFVRSVHVSTTHGPALPLDLATVAVAARSSE